MSTPVNLRDADTGSAVKVSADGEIAIAPLSFNDVHQQSSSDINIHSIVNGKADKVFIIKSVIIAQDKTNTDVNVSLFESDELDGASTRALFAGSTTRSDRIIVPLLDVKTGKTKWISFQHDSATATLNVTVTGYYTNA